jgi:hypothetical protein
MAPKKKATVPTRASDEKGLVAGTNSWQRTENSGKNS